MTRDELIASAIANLHKHWPKGIPRNADNKQIAALAIVECADRVLADPQEGDWLKVSQTAARNAMADAYHGQAHAVSMSKNSHRRGETGTSKGAAAVLAHAPMSLGSPDTPEPEAPDTIAQADARILVAQLLDRAAVTLDLRDMIALRFGLNGEREYSYAEIGARYGCSSNTAQKRIERVLERLREVQ